MITQEFQYSRPSTLNDALNLLADGSAKALAGGMSLIPAMKLRLAAPETIVDLGRIPELSYIKEDGGVIRIGAMTTHWDIESSPLLRSKCPLLPLAAGYIGDVQVRNRGTIGGSIAHADPAADWPASLLAVEAKVKIQSAGKSREISAEDFFIDTFTTALEPGELVTEIIVPADPAGAAYTYSKFEQPASGFAIVGVAVHVVKAGGKANKCRVGVTGLSGKPFRAKNVEAAIEAGKPVAEAVAQIAAGVDANSDIHATADYRKHIAKIYARRALESVLA
jgi:aerobic carbon-monoxide dehydrogenase medium subunit